MIPLEAGHSVQASYAMGYNLAIEYLADYEKTWMLDSFRKLSRDILAPQGRALTEWVFLEVRPPPLPPLPSVYMHAEDVS